MRLIDADALKEKKVYSHERHERIVPVAEIDWMPTIDAIPVKWLQKRRDIYLKSYHAGHECDLHTAAILHDTLIAWQKEQEAQNG